MFNFLTQPVKFWIVVLDNGTIRYFRSDSPGSYTCVVWNAANDSPDEPLIHSYEAVGDVNALIDEARSAGRFQHDKNGTKYYNAYTFWKKFEERKSQLAA